jgi:hypothetical protein
MQKYLMIWASTVQHIGECHNPLWEIRFTISIPFQCHQLTVSATLAKPLAYPVFGPWRSLKPQLDKAKPTVLR